MRASGGVVLDVRPVEPKDRFALIMDAYRCLEEGEALELTVDHDPSCMYYTLLAEEREGSFGFTYLEKGPITWRVRVRKVGGVGP